ncbi:Hypothetical predicted protein [Olea europaea subsp. europaea]|uniref:Zuotin-like zuotin homology domain-containing protein n=1 Tax=Olea europaea subsp. europaea TaxID=158383 RepID=A0A8S0QTQ3_OLEEU|nr:Hypothetical predicted protein [Olea europaea subsp. europaea]
MIAQKGIRLIMYSPEIIGGEPIHVFSNGLLVKASKLEPAGHAFHAVALRLIDLLEEENADDGGKKEILNEKEHVHVESSNSNSNKGKKKFDGETKRQDHYALLGLSHLRRRVYDSTYQFDDEIRSDCALQDFFKDFGPTFLRNGHWLVNQPVPTLGDDNSTVKEVAFMIFGTASRAGGNFLMLTSLTLRTLSVVITGGGWKGRMQNFQRRQERINIHVYLLLLTMPIKGILEFYKEKEEQKAEKQRKNEAKLLAKKLQEEEAARIAEEERRRKEEEERKAAKAALSKKKLKEKEKKLLRKERTYLRTLSSPILSQRLMDLSNDYVESFCMSLDIKQLLNLCDKMEEKEGLERYEVFREVLRFDHKLKDGK